MENTLLQQVLPQDQATPQATLSSDYTIAGLEQLSYRYLSRGQLELMVLGGGPLPLRKSLAEDLFKFMLENKGNLVIHPNWKDNLKHQLLRLLDVGQLLAYVREGKLVGLFGWAFIDDINSVNKVRWTLPDDITGGKILYLSFAILFKGEQMGLVKRYFEETGTRDRINQVYWGNIKRSKNYNRRVK